MKEIKRKEAEDLLRHHTEGKIFSALFIKRDGNRRLINCRTKVHKLLSGKGLRFNPVKYGFLVVYDMQKNGYRMINIKTLIEFKFKKEYYKVI